MVFTKLLKRSKILTLISICSFLVCMLTDAYSKDIKNTTGKNFFTGIKKIRQFSKQFYSKKIKENKNLVQVIYMLSQGPTKGFATIPEDQILYLQQANTQINSDTSVISTKESVLPNHSTPLNDVAADALLEELLGVHTIIQDANPKQKSSVWANFSFDFSIGAGAVFYTNRLQQMYLLQRQPHDYFFITKGSQVYKPNWFHDTLNQVTEFDASDRVVQGTSKNVAFQGKGFALPITLGIQYIFSHSLFVGVGREVMLNAISRLVHNDGAIKHKAYIMHKKWSAQGRWFAKFGWYAFGNEKYRFFGDIRLFYVEHLGRMFCRLATFGPYLHRTLAYNFGLGYEQQLTHYLAYTARLAIEWQSFKQQFPNPKPYDYNIQYKQPAIYLQVGFSVRSMKSNPSRGSKSKECQNKNNLLNDLSKLEGLEVLQDLLELD